MIINRISLCIDVILIPIYADGSCRNLIWMIRLILTRDWPDFFKIDHQSWLNTTNVSDQEYQGLSQWWMMWGTARLVIRLLYLTITHFISSSKILWSRSDSLLCLVIFVTSQMMAEPMRDILFTLNHLMLMLWWTPVTHHHQPKYFIASIKNIEWRSAATNISLLQSLSSLVSSSSWLI